MAESKMTNWQRLMRIGFSFTFIMVIGHSALPCGASPWCCESWPVAPPPPPGSEVSLAPFLFLNHNIPGINLKWWWWWMLASHADIWYFPLIYFVTCRKVGFCKIKYPTFPYNLFEMVDTLGKYTEKNEHWVSVSINQVVIENKLIVFFWSQNMV